MKNLQAASSRFRHLRARTFLHVITLVLRLLLFISVVVSKSTIKSLPGFYGNLPFLLETGYIGVGNLEEKQLFYYFVESERSPENDPLVLWLTGGPGCSAFSGLVYEIGPLSFNYTNSRENKPVLELNPYSWTKFANIIFVDAPVGSGFSYSTTWEGYQVSDTISAAEIYDFLRKWLGENPSFLTNPLYIAGDSYSGITVPIVVQEISNGNEAGLQSRLDLQGYVLGNPLTDWNTDINSRVPFAHGMGLISNKLYESFRTNCKSEYRYPDLSNALCMEAILTINQCLGKLRQGHVLEPECKPIFSIPVITTEWDPSVLIDDDYSTTDIFLSSLQIPKPWCRLYHYAYSYFWANDKTVQDALHIREGTIKEWNRCNRSLSYTYDVNSSIDYHINLTNKAYRALIYSGDHDLRIPYVGTVAWIESLSLTIVSDWEPWFVEGQVAGYKTQYSYKAYELTFATVKGGGHTAPEYKPVECFAMIKRWFAYYPL